MGAAAEGATVVDPTLAATRMKKRAAAIRRGHYFLAAGRALGAGGDPGLAAGKVGRATGMPEAATIRQAGAIPGERTTLPLGIDVAHLASGFVEVQAGRHGWGKSCGP